MHISASSQAEGRSKERGRPQKVSSSLSGPEGRGGAAVETVCCAFSRPQPDGGVRSPKRMLHGLARQIHQVACGASQQAAELDPLLQGVSPALRTILWEFPVTSTPGTWPRAVD